MNIYGIKAKEQNHSFYDLHNIPRCPECNLISSLKLYYKEGKPIINYYCENFHRGAISLQDYLNEYNNHSLLKQKCQECYKNQKEVQTDFFYCYKCNKFICHSCILNHPTKEKHNVINIERFDSFCKIHCNSFYSYCIKCKKNICVYCYPEHESHELINLSKYNYNKETKNELEEEIEFIEKKIKDLDILKEEIISEIDQLKRSNELEIKLYKLLINTYKYEESQNNLNYNVIQNIKNFEEIFGLNKIQMYGEIYFIFKKY